jgi:NAD(P)-dependent dehydrogenase (short-subunit alcohol dehydrogenase family)
MDLRLEGRTPDEVARLIAFVASPTNVTGAAYVIDGGVLKGG